MVTAFHSRTKLHPLLYYSTAFCEVISSRAIENPQSVDWGFEASFDENSWFTQLLKVRSCVTIKCRPPQRKKLLGANRLIA